MKVCRSLYFPYTGFVRQNVSTMYNREDLCTPAAQGLYDPSTESDACGVGFVVQMKGRKSHAIVEQALQVLMNLEHRGACGCEANTGDGAGILIQMPDTFFRTAVPFTLPAVGSYGAGLVFLPHDERDRDAIKEIFARIIAEEGQALLGWREVPTDNRDLGGAPIDRVGAMALIVAAIGWSVASALARKVPLPPSKVMSSGAQMLAGGVFLGIAATSLGELRGFDPGAVSTRAWIALVYLIVPGSIIAFTAYVWLLHHESPTKVGTYAYVNPVVAVVLGYFVAGEALDRRTLLGTACVLISVVVITLTRTKAPSLKAR